MNFTDPTGLELRVTGEAAFVQKTVADLQKLDPNVTINKAGVISTSTGDSAGNTLISGLVNNSNTITIQAGKSSGTTPNSETAAENGTGTGSTVTIGATSQPYYVKDKNGVISLTTTAPSEIVLGHELIHADHNANGVKDDSSTTFTYPITGTSQGQKVNTKFDLTTLSTPYPSEEGKTVGLGQYANNGVTENALREQLHYNQRASYDN